MTVASSSATADSTVTVASSSLPSTVMAAPIIEVESSDNAHEVNSSLTSSHEVETIEGLELRAQALEAAQAAAEARLRVAEARSSRATTRTHSLLSSRAPSVTSPNPVF